MQSIEYLQAVLVLQSVTSQAFFFLLNQLTLELGVERDSLGDGLGDSREMRVGCPIDQSRLLKHMLKATYLVAVLHCSVMVVVPQAGAGAGTGGLGNW